MATPDSESPNATPEPTDGTLVGKTLAGQKSAFNELIRRYQRRATAVAYRLLGNLQDALDIAQEAFLKAFINLPTLQKAEAFGAWLMRIVSNLSLNFRRSRKSLGLLPLDDLLPAAEETAASPVHQLCGTEIGSKIERALVQLPERQQNAILLFAVEQMPQKDVARSLGCSVEAVKWHVFDGRRKLRQILGDCL